MSSENPIVKFNVTDGRLTLKVEMEVLWSLVTNAITGCMEGGYSPWIGSFNPDANSRDLARASRGGEHTVWYNDPAFWINDGKAEMLYDGENDTEGSAASRMVIDKQALINGLTIMATKAPRHFEDLINENDDAITHDVFMQMVVFGDIIYG